MQHLDEYLPSPIDDEEFREDMLAFRDAALQCLLYSYGARDSDDPEYEDLLFTSSGAKLQRLLEANFFNRLYIERPIASELVRLIQLERLVVLKGGIGSGKSTLLKRLEHLYQNEKGLNGTVVHYVDLLSAFERLPKNDLTQEEGDQESEQVCQIIFRSLLDRFSLPAHSKRSSTALEVFDRWDIFEVRNHPFYEDFKELIVKQERPSNEAEWLEVLRDRDYSLLRLQEYSKPKSNQGTANLKTFLLFLRRVLGLHCIVMVDNIDRYSLMLQAKVIDKAIDFASSTDLENPGPPLLTPVIAVRTGNFRRLSEEGVGDYTFIAKRIDDYSPGEAQIADDDATVQRFIQRRLEFLNQIDTHSLLGVEAAQRISEVLGFGSRREFLRAHETMFGELRSQLSHLDVARVLRRWNNGDLRRTGSCVFGLLNAFITGRDPFLSYNAVLRRLHRNGSPGQPGAKSADRLETRAIRTMTFRHMVFGNARPPKPPRVVSLFETWGKAEKQPGPYALSRLAVLEHLWAASDARRRFREVRSTLEQVGLKFEEIASAINRLAESKGDVPQLIHIDGRRQLVTDGTRGDRWIELTDAGQYFVSFLSVSCEYLFWIALTTDLQKRLFPASVKLTTDRILTDAFRARVATDFLTTSVLPGLFDEFEWVARRRDLAPGQSSTRLYCEAVGIDSVYPERAASGIDSFLTTHRIAGAEKDELQNSLRGISRTCADKWGA